MDFAGEAQAREQAKRELSLHSGLAGLGVDVELGAGVRAAQQVYSREMSLTSAASK